MGLRDRWTHEELADLRRELEAELVQTERENPGVRPLPPMTEDEARGLLLDLVWTAKGRILTNAEAFMAGQLIAAYRMAVEARMLGRRGGRYFVIGEEELKAVNLRRNSSNGLDGGGQPGAEGEG